MDLESEIRGLIEICMCRGISAKSLKQAIAELWQEVHEEEGQRGRKELEK